MDSSEHVTSTKSNLRWSFVLPSLLLLAAIPALAIDCRLSEWFLAGRFPGDLAKLLDIAETFGHGCGVVLILLAIHQLDPRRRWAIPRLATCAFGSGIAADVVKMTVERTRPHHFDFQTGVFSTFGDLFPLTGAGSGGQSFPSAHTATAVGLAFGLIWLYPHGRRLFIALAVMVACQRLESGAHYLSDTLCGAAIGCLVSTVCLQTRSVSARFERLESRWKPDEP